MTCLRKIFVIAVFTFIAQIRADAVSTRAEPPINLRCEDHDMQRRMVWQPQRSWMRKVINYKIQYRKIICSKCKYRNLPCLDEERNEVIVNLTQTVCVVPPSKLKLDNYYEFRIKALYRNHGTNKTKSTQFAHEQCPQIFQNTTYSAPLVEITTSPSSITVNLTLPPSLQGRRKLMKEYDYDVRYNICVDKFSRLGGQCSREMFQSSQCRKVVFPRFTYDHDVESSSKYCVVTWFKVDTGKDSDVTANVIAVPKKPLTKTERVIVVASLTTCLIALIGLLSLAWMVKEKWRQMNKMLRKKIPDYLVEMKMDGSYEDTTRTGSSSFRLGKWELLQMQKLEEMYEDKTSFVDDVETSFLLHPHLLKLTENERSTEVTEATVQSANRFSD